MKYLDRLNSKIEELASSVAPPKLTKLQGEARSPTGIELLGERVSSGVSMAIRDGLDQLSGMAPPDGACSAVWREVVTDAVRLLNEGHAEEALANGWLPLHLWGSSPLASGASAYEGLAVRLMGRRVCIYESHAIMWNSVTARSVFTPSKVLDAVFLWELHPLG